MLLHRCRVQSCSPADPWPRGQGLCPAPSTRQWAGTDSSHRPSGHKGKRTARSHWLKAAVSCSRRTQPELLGRVPGPGGPFPVAPPAPASFLACRPQVSAGEALSAASCWEALSSCVLTFLSQLAPFLPIRCSPEPRDCTWIQGRASVGRGHLWRGVGESPAAPWLLPGLSGLFGETYKDTLHLWTGSFVAEHMAFRPSRGFRKGLNRTLSL